MTESEVVTLFFVGVLFWATVWGMIGYAIEKSKGGGGGLGAFLGVALGPIGVVIVAVRAPEALAAVAGPPATATRECPSCKEAMRRDASVCPHCRRDSVPWVFHEGRWWTKDNAGQDVWLDERLSVWVKHAAQPTPSPD